MKRCEICDYSEELGSEYSGAPPSRNRIVRSDHRGILCTECRNSITETYAEYFLKDNDDDTVAKDPPTLPEV